MGWKMKAHKRQSNYVLQSENRGWEEDESQLGEGGSCYRCAKGSKKAQQIPERLLRKIFGCCGVKEVDRKAHTNCHVYTHLVFL